MNRAERRAAEKEAKKNGHLKAVIPGDTDYNEPDAPPPPQGLAGDVFEIAALVNTVKATFHLKEETALKTVDLAISVLLATKQMNQMGMPFIPPGAKPLTPEELAARETEASDEPADAAPETHHQEDA